MLLTEQQAATVKAYIDADPQMSVIPNNSDGAFEIARLFNLPANPTVLVWRTDAPVAVIYDAINWSQYTPSWVPNSSDSPATAAVYTNALLMIQTKQMNLQAMTQGRESVNAAKLNVRTGLRDCVISVPSGAIAGGAPSNVSPGGASGVNVLTNCVRPASRIEALLSRAAPTLGTITANIMGFEGGISYTDIEEVRN